MTAPLSKLALRAVVDVWPDDAHTVHDARGTCIESVRMVLPVLGRLGVACKPLPCAVWAGNQLAWQLFQAGVRVADWPPEAHSVGVDPDQGHRRGERGWNGHLVVAGDDWLLDLTAPQLHRPDRGVNVRGAVLATDTPAPPRDRPLVLGADDTTLIYTPRPELARWRVTDAWRQDVPADLTAAIVQRVHRRLREVASVVTGGGS